MSWWSRFFRRAHMERQLEKELRFHLDQHETDLVARGRAPAEARRDARLALGGPEQVKEKCRDARGARWLEELLQDACYAARTFRRKPGFPLVTLLILALGIGASTVMFAVVESVLLRPLPFPQPKRLVTLHGSIKDFGEFWGFSYGDFIDIRHDVRSLRVAAWAYTSGTLSAPGKPEHVEARLISAELFDVLGIAPAYGRSFRPDEDRPGATPVAMISYDLWQRRFAWIAPSSAKSWPSMANPGSSRHCAPGFSIVRRSGGYLHASRPEYRSTNAESGRAFHSGHRTHGSAPV